jgi:hypothetical protein
MISQGASEINMSFMIDEDDADEAVRSLHATFFKDPDPAIFDVEARRQQRSGIPGLRIETCCTRPSGIALDITQIVYTISLWESLTIPPRMSVTSANVDSPSSGRRTYTPATKTCRWEPRFRF